MLNSSIQFDKKIGEGAFGVVYRITIFNKVYALKIEKKKGSIDKEIRALTLLKHSSIPQIHAMGIFKGYKFIVIPFFKFSLVQILKYKKEYFTSKVIAAIAWNVVDALKCIHSANMIYGDLKPENIMIDTNSKIYLIDFGMCVFRSEIHRGQIRGTLRYASINTHKGNLVGPKDDLESLGYLLVFLITGKLPWLQENKNSKILEIKMNTNYEKLKLGEQWTSLVTRTISGELTHEKIKEKCKQIVKSFDLFKGYDLLNLFCCRE